MDENNLTEKIIGAAIEVHKVIGPGLLESIYEECLAVELVMQHIQVDRQKPVPLEYKGKPISKDLKIDFLVDNKVIVELKAVERLMPVHEAQLLSYLRLTDCKVGLLLNFNVPVMKNGIKRMVNNFKD